MGNSQSQLFVCPYCATELDFSSISIENSNSFICGRCHGTIKKIKPRKTALSKMSFLSSSNDNITKDTQSYITIKYINIGPFENGLKSLSSSLTQSHDHKEEKNDENIIISDHYILDNFIKPYFRENEHKNIRMSAGNRFIIKNIGFKIISCYPTNGFITDSTIFNLNDNNDQLLILKYRPIKQIHLLPTLSSLSIKQKINKINHIDRDKLYQSYLKPYLRGNDNSLYIQSHNSLNKRHLMENEKFIYKNIEWKVIKSQPIDGFINASTTVYCNGPALNDIKSIKIRPKYETLPINQQNWNSMQIKKHYLTDHLFGKLYFKYLNANDLRKYGFIINNVQFMIHEIDPNISGIITCTTEIDMTPIKSVEILYIQQQHDMKFAQRLQEQEYDRILSGMNQLMLFEAMQQMELERDNDNDTRYNYPHLAMSGPFASFAQISARLHELQRMERIRREESHGLNQQLINILPVYKHSIKNGLIKECDVNVNVNVNDDDHISCRICLEEYEQDEEIKILPCFHKYHKMCIDNWLKHSVKCPICNTSIFD